MSSPSPQPISIVSGLPRSGTSMMMQMLDAGGVEILTDHVRTPDDDNPKGYYEFEPVKQIKTDKTWLNDAPGKAVKMVHLLLHDLPLDRPYQVIFMRRHIEEVLASQSAMLRRTGKKGADLPTDRLAAMFTQQLEKTQQWLTDHPNIRSLIVYHHEILNDPSSQAARVNDFLGGRLDVAKMADVVDSSLHRQKRPA